MTKTNTKPTSVIAKSDDGTIQLTFTIPFEIIKKEREHALKELSESVEVPGFRKGKAPIDKVSDHVSQNTLLEKTLTHILPELLTESIKEHSIKPIVYPKFELIKAKDDEEWEVRATTCEAPKIKLGDYKKDLTKITQTKTEIWTPEKGDSSKKSENATKSREEKEQEILKILLDSSKVTIPSILIDEEVNNRLSNLLSRLERLGLSLDSYLASIGKTAEKLREEYVAQSKEGLSLDFILNEVAEIEKIGVSQPEIDASIKAAAQDPNLTENIDTPERRRFIEAILKRRKALDHLISLTK